MPSICAAKDRAIGTGIKFILGSHDKMPLFEITSDNVEFFSKAATFFVVGSAVLVAVAAWAQIEISNTKARFSDERIAENERLTAEANERAVKLEVEAEKLRERNLVFERAIAPRILEQRLTGQRLSKHDDVLIIIRTAPDFEARRTAQQIKYMLLAEAKWKEFKGQIETDPEFRLPPLSYGVRVYSGIGDRQLLNGSDTPHEVILEIMDKRRTTRLAGDDLVAVLNENDIRAEGGPPLELPSDVILIVVGLKPLPQELDIDAEKYPKDPTGVTMYGNLLE